VISHHLIEQEAKAIRIRALFCAACARAASEMLEDVPVD
jgi:hypothetical protein